MLTGYSRAEANYYAEDDGFDPDDYDPETGRRLIYCHECKTLTSDEPEWRRVEDGETIHFCSDECAGDYDRRLTAEYERRREVTDNCSTLLFRPLCELEDLTRQMRIYLTSGAQPARDWLRWAQELRSRTPAIAEGLDAFAEQWEMDRP